MGFSVGTTTSIYTHVATEDDGAVGNIFDFDDETRNRPATPRDKVEASDAAQADTYSATPTATFLQLARRDKR